MKKFFTICIAYLLFSGSGIAQTATNFTVNDCSGISRTLFNEVDAGKVVVLVWVMPCATCVGPALSSYNIVQSLSGGSCNILYYLADDYGNSSCATITSWANTYNIAANSIKFSNSAINMTHYGLAGMPKVVIIGGPLHKVYFNQNDALDINAFQTALNLACSESGTSIGTSSNNYQEFSVYPNPASQITSFAFSLNSVNNIAFDVFNQLGDKVISIPLQKYDAGKNTVDLNLSGIPAGVYSVRMTSNNHSTVKRFTITGK